MTSLPDTAHEKFKEHFKTVESIKSVSTFLTFLRANPSLVEDKRTDIYEWFDATYGNTNTDTKSIDSSSAKETTSSDRSQARKGSQNRHPKGGSFSLKNNRTESYCKLSALADDVCTHLLCRNHNRKHSYEKCFRHTDMAKFNALNQDGSTAKPKGNNRSFKNKPSYVAAMRQVHRLQAGDSIGNTLTDQDYNKVKEFDPYIREPASDGIIAPINIQGITLRALVDLGSAISVLGVLDLDYYDFIIEMELFHKFGYSIGGIQAPILSDDDDDVPIVNDLKPKITASQASDEENTKAFKQAKEEFLQTIAQDLKQNNSIDPKSHCPLKIMRVALEVNNNCVIEAASRRFYAQAVIEE
ncbi:hypothetical protein BGZ76_004107, partial [Entomortierella beljakovae]